MKTGQLQVTTPTEREIVMTRIFASPRTAVFDALTRPDLLKCWCYGPDGWSMVDCEVDLRVGGTYRFVLRGTDGTRMGLGGVYREVVPPERIVNTELFDQDWTGGESVATTVLEEEGGKTTLTSTVRYSSKEARDGALKSGMLRGVGASYDRLEELLVSAAARGSEREAREPRA
jgi:uncharacterized protein YndB with AHSA1/START domain